MSAQERFDVEMALRRLPAHDVHPDRVERTRRRCLAALEAARRPAPERGASLLEWTVRLEPVAAVALSALYLAAAVQASMVLLAASGG